MAKARTRNLASKANAAAATSKSTLEKPIAPAKQVETAQEERLENNPEGTRIDGTTARHTEPLGPPAPGQGGRPGPERRVFPNNGTVPNERTEEEVAEAARDRGPLVRVAALRMGYYDHARRRPGDVFNAREADISDRWMERVDGRTPLKITTGKAALKAKHDERLASTMASKEDAAGRSSGDRNPLGDD